MNEGASQLQNGPTDPRSHLKDIFATINISFWVSELTDLWC